MSSSRIIAPHSRFASFDADLEAVVFNGINVRHLRSKSNTILMSVLLLAATLNTSQAMVLCQGGDGHVAIEPVGQNCCTHARQTDSSRAVNSQMSGTTRVGNTCGPSCVDTPIGGDVCDKPTISSTSKIDPAKFAVLWAPLQASGGNAATVTASAWLMPMVAPCTVLSSIVLQV